jgi:hypothetical protein
MTKEETWRIHFPSAYRPGAFRLMELPSEVEQTLDAGEM